MFEKKLLTGLVILSTFISAYTVTAQKDFQALSLLDSMNNAILQIKTFSFTLKNIERIEGKMLTGEQQIKLSLNPFQCLITSISPNPGAKVLFVKGKNNNKAIYLPNGFPYIKMYFDPLGDIMRHHNHHTVYELGMYYLGSIIKKSITNTNAAISYVGIVQWNNQKCHKITIENTDFAYLKYISTSTETLYDIAQKKILSDYMLLECNPHIDSYDEKLTGKSIKIPNQYFKKAELYIESKTYLPVFQKIYDDKGLFEQYEYRDVKINPAYSTNEFSELYLSVKEVQ